MPKHLPASFFSRPTLHVAGDLLGKFLVHRTIRQIGQAGSVQQADSTEKDQIALMISEVEAYDGPNDRASHASKGRTPRNEVMFGPAGFWYVYFVYGMHWMLNIVTGAQDYPAAILIRGAGEYNGPGKLTRALHVDKNLNGKPATPQSGLWIEDRGTILKNPIQKTPRIGVNYAGKEWAEKAYRFFISE